MIRTLKAETRNLDTFSCTSYITDGNVHFSKKSCIFTVL